MASPTNRQYTVLSIGTLAALVFCVFIARVFDSPTSVFLIMGVAVLAIGSSFYFSRTPRA